MRLGAQVSVSGGLINAFENAKAIKAETLMFYTKSNRQWRSKPITTEDAQAFKDGVVTHQETIFPHVIHANYLMNLASPEEDKWAKSYESLIDEINRVAQIGLKHMVMHPGSHMKTGEETGLAKIAAGLKRALDETADSAPEVVICLENMAGQGTNLGYKFEHLAYLLEHTDGGSRLGVCFDTCHAFAGGYDLRTPEAYAATMAEFERLVGLDHIKCFHFNDSKHDLGSRRDRHEHVGQGSIGAEGFANFVNDPRWVDHAAHLETPKTMDDEQGHKIEMDPVNLDTLRQLIR